MTPLERVQVLIEEIGPSMPDVEAVAQDGDFSWAVAFPDNLVVVLELDPTGRRLMAAIDVGRPEEEDKFEAYETALTYGYLWRDTGGARLALGGPDGELTLLTDLEVAELTLADLQATLLDVVEKGRLWQGYFAGIGSAPIPQEAGI